MIKKVYYWHYGLESEGPYDSWQAAIKAFEIMRDVRGWKNARPKIQEVFVKVDDDID